MAASPADGILHYIRVLMAAQKSDPRDDAELLTRYADTRDERAFAVLVGRHGPLVWRVCKAVVRKEADAEDAFQGTFFLLAQKASRLRREALAGWLHRVARQTALNIRSASERRQRLEERAGKRTEPEIQPKTQFTDQSAILDEELAGLPERLRVPLVLRYLNGETLEGVARTLGVSIRAVTKRLARGEALLRERLAKRGVEAGVVTALLAGSAEVSAVPARLIENTARATMAFRAGALSGGAADAAEKVLRSLSWKGITGKSWWLVFACIGALAIGGAGLVTWKTFQSDSAAVDAPAAQVVTKSQTVAARKSNPQDDAYGDPLPSGALARIGTVRFHQTARNIAFLADGKSFVAAGDTIRVWNLASGKEERRLEGYPGGVEFRGFSSKSNQVAFKKKGEHVIRLWNAVTGQELSIKNPVICNDVQMGYRENVGTCPDGKLVALTWSKPGSFRLLDVETGVVRVEGKLNNQNAEPHTFAWSPDNKAIALDTKDGVIIWDISAGRVRQTLPVPNGLVHGLSYSFDGSVLVGICTDDKVYVWDAIAGKERCHYEAGSDEPFAISPDGKQLVTHVASLKTLVLHNLDTGKEIQLKRGGWEWITQYCGSAFTPDGKKFVCGGSNAIRCWDVDTGREIIPAADVWEMIFDVAVSPDGRLLATADKGGGVQLWDSVTGHRVRKLADTVKPDHSTSGTYTFVAFTSDGRKLVSISCRLSPEGPKRTMRMWDIVENGASQEFPLLQGLPARLSLSPDGKFAAIFNDSMSGCMVVNAENGKETLLDIVNGVLAFAPNGKNLSVGSSRAGTGYSLALLDRTTGNNLRVQENIFSDPNRRLTYLAYSPDSRCLASTDNKGGVQLWEAATLGILWNATQEDETHKERRYRSVMFAPDGRTLAIVGSDGGSADPYDRVHLWEVATGQEIYQITENGDSSVTGVAFIGDSRRLVSWSTDGTALVWNLPELILKRQERKSPLSTKQLQELWDDLVGKDASRAYQAVHQLAIVPVQAVQLLREHLRAAPRPDSDRVKRLIQDLDSDTFAVRQRATTELNNLGESAAGELRRVLEESPSVEVRRRVERLLHQCTADVESLASRQLRALAVLEYIDSHESRLLLKTLAEGAPGARLTEEAKTTLGRLVRGAH